MNVSMARTGKLIVPRWVRALAFVLFALLAGGLAVAVPPAGAQDLGADDPAGALELAERYAPIMMLKAQEAACDENGEPYAPTSVDILMGNPEILLRQLGTDNPVIKAGPEPSDLYGLGEGFFLDFPGSALQPDCIYEKDFDKYSQGRPAVVYAHIVKQPEHPDQLALQYWFYWYYNDWNNKHESDWEGIQLLFTASTIAEALSTEPDSVGYAQHEGGSESTGTPRDCAAKAPIRLCTPQPDPTPATSVRRSTSAAPPAKGSAATTPRVPPIASHRTSWFSPTR